MLCPSRSQSDARTNPETVGQRVDLQEGERAVFFCFDLGNENVGCRIKRESILVSLAGSANSEACFYFTEIHVVASEREGEREREICIG